MSSLELRIDGKRQNLREERFADDSARFKEGIAADSPTYGERAGGNERKKRARAPRPMTKSFKKKISRPAHKRDVGAAKTKAYLAPLYASTLYREPYASNPGRYNSAAVPWNQAP